MLIGVAAILNGPVSEETIRLWEMFDEKYSSTGVESCPFPHVTFQMGICDDLDALDASIETECKEISPFEITIDGLGSFESPAKVIFLKVTATDELLEINNRLNELLIHYCREIDANYLPGRWVPHNTVAVGDLTDRNYRKAMSELRDYHPEYCELIHSIHLFKCDEETGIWEIVKEYKLTGAAQGVLL